MSLEQMLLKPGKKMGETSLIPQHEKQILFSAQIFEGCHVGEIQMGNWFTKAPPRGMFVVGGRVRTVGPA